jgi:lipopolysaccharide export system permease protein
LYVLRQHLVPWLLGFGVVSGVLQVDLLADYLDLWVERGIPLWAVTQLFLFALGWMSALSVPCGVLVASLMTFGRMSQDFEIVAIKSSGINLFQVLLAPLLAAGALSVALAGFNTFVLPETNHAYANLLADIGRKRPTVRLRAGVFNDDFPGYRLLVERLDPRTNELFNVSLLEFGGGPSPVLIVARSGRLSYTEDGGTAVLVLRDGELHEEPADPNATPGTYRVLRFNEHVVRVAGAGALLERQVRELRSEREMTTAQLLDETSALGDQLRAARARLGERLAAAGYPPSAASWVEGGEGPAGALAAAWATLTGARLPAWQELPPEDLSELTLSRIEVSTVRKRLASYEVEIHKKYSLAFACVIFVLVGAPLGVRVRRGGPTVGFLSLVFFLFYFIALVAGEAMAERLLLPAAFSMWAPNGVLAALGIAWTWAACDLGWRRRPRIDAA